MRSGDSRPEPTVDRHSARRSFRRFEETAYGTERFLGRDLKTWSPPADPEMVGGPDPVKLFGAAWALGRLIQKCLRGRPLAEPSRC
jgi:hypothetical protein